MRRLEFTFEDPEEMPERVSELASVFAVLPRASGPFKAKLTAARFGELALFEAALTQSRLITLDKLGYYSISLARSGSFQAKVNGQSGTFKGDTALVVNPNDCGLEMDMPSYGRQLVLNVFKPQLEDYADAMSGGSGDGPINAPNWLSLDNEAGQAFRRYLSFIWSEVQRDSALFDTKLIRGEMEKALLAAFLLAIDPRREHGDDTVAPIYLQRAVDFIMAQLSEPLSLADIAGAVGVHARTLQRSFQAQYGRSVMAFVQERRLERVHTQLLAADPASIRVKEIAMRNGFWHLGRFSSSYRRRFGELPSQTLHRTRIGGTSGWS